MPEPEPYVETPRMLERLATCYGEEGVCLVEFFEETLSVRVVRTLDGSSLPPPPPPSPPPRSLLLSGPPGIGKTHWIRAVEKEYAAKVITLDAGNILGSGRASVSATLDDAWREVVEGKGRSCIIVLDHLEDIYPRGMEGRDPSIYTLTSILSRLEALPVQDKVLFIATALTKASVDPILVSAFGEKIELSVPTVKERSCMLCGALESLGGDVPWAITEEEMGEIAGLCHGLLPSDLVEAVKACVRRGLGPDGITYPLLRAACLSHPGKDSATRAPLTPVRWDHIGGLDEVKQQLKETVMWFHEHGDALERLGVTPSRGALLYGPPGTGKTMLARAVATEANVPFYPLSISELLDAQIGESERAISRVFHEAKRLAPCILFLDECDALFGSRDSGGNLGKKMVTQLMLELDGLAGLVHPVVVLCATNHPEVLDGALTRAGRLDTLIHVPLPDEAGRRSILQAQAATMPISPSVTRADMDRWVGGSAGWSGAEMVGMLRWAGLEAIFRMGYGVEAGFDGTISAEGMVSTTDIDVAMQRMERVRV